jgi:hypothetical protein
MKTTTNQPTSVPPKPKRIILASAYRHEQHSAARQERALKTIRKMGHFEDNDALDHRHIYRTLPAQETLDD